MLILPTLALTLNLILTLTQTLIPIPNPNIFINSYWNEHYEYEKFIENYHETEKISENGTRVWNNRYFYLFLKKFINTDSKNSLKNL